MYPKLIFIALTGLVFSHPAFAACDDQQSQSSPATPAVQTLLDSNIVPVFKAPTVLREGAPLKPAYEPTVLFNCSTGSVRLKPCAAGGEQISKPFFEHVLPDLDACVRSTLHELNGYDGADPIVVGHVGITSSRDVAGTKTLSLHAAARAIDITSISVGKKVFNYPGDFKTRSTSTNFARFWMPLSSCMRTSKSAFYWTIDAASEMEDVRGVAREKLATNVAAALPGLFTTLGDEGNPIIMTHEDFVNYNHIRDVTTAVMDAYAKTFSSSIRNDVSLQKAMIDGLAPLGVTVTPAQASKWIGEMAQGTFHHLDHMHLSMPFTPEEAKQPRPQGAPLPKKPVAPARDDSNFTPDADPDTRAPLLEDYASGM